VKLTTTRSRNDYRALCAMDPTIPLFQQAWWLDAVCGDDGWEVVLALRGEEIIGALPYLPRRVMGLKVISQPTLTQISGPWVKASKARYPKALAYEKDVLQALARALPAFHYYAQNWHFSRMNWLPFYWLGFRQTTRYTYRLSLGGGEEDLWRNLQENIRTDVRKERFGISIRPARDLGEFLELNRMTFARQGRQLPYSREIVQRLDEAASQRGVRDVFVAEGPGGEVHAAAYVVRDADTAYYLMGGGDPSLRSSGATSLCLWEAILHQPQHIESFDFEGSMLEPVERFFRAFGARQVPYFRVSKSCCRLLDLALCISGTGAVRV